MQNAAATPSTRWAILTCAPHRWMFFLGMLQGLAAIAWWLADLGGRFAGLYPAPTWALPPSWAHAAAMNFHLLPFFMLGFLMTAMPNWLGGRVARGEYLPAGLMMAGGSLLFMAGMATLPALAAAGLLLHAAGWIVALRALVRLARESTTDPDPYPYVLISALLAGVTGETLLAAGLAAGSASLADWSRHVGIWLFALPVFWTVATRMVPFFSRIVFDGQPPPRPPWALWVGLAASVAHGLLAGTGLGAWTWLVDLPLGLLTIQLSLRWGFTRCLRVRLLAVLHLSLAGLAAAMLLSGAQSLAWFAGTAVLGAGPLHLLTVGFFTAMVVGMASRVSLGHSGRALEADALTWYAFLAIQASALLRLAAELPGLSALNAVAGTLWLLAFGAWAARFLPVYLSPRIDGRPG